MDATAYLFENLQKMHEAESKNKRKVVKENKELKESKKIYAPKDYIKKYFSMVKDNLDEEYLDIYSKLDTFKDDDNDLQDLAIAIQDELIDLGYNTYGADDGSNDWVVEESKKMETEKKDETLLEDSSNLDATISKIKSRLATNESCDCKDDEEKEELDDDLNDLAKVNGLGAEDILNRLYMPDNELKKLKNNLVQESDIEDDELDESCKSKKEECDKPLTEALNTIDNMTFEYMRDAIDSLEKYFNKHGNLTDELKSYVNSVYTTLDKIYEITDLDAMMEACKKDDEEKEGLDESCKSKKDELKESLAHLDGASLNKLITTFVKDNYKNIDKIIFSKAMLEGNALTFKGKMKFTTGKVENIELKADNFSKKLFAKESFNLGVTDKLNTFHIVKESKNIPFVITCKNINGKVMFESLHYNYLVENVKEPVKGRIKL